MSPKPAGLRAPAKPNQQDSPVIATGSNNEYYGNCTDSDFQSVSAPVRAAAVGLRGGRYVRHSLADRLAARTIIGPSCWEIQGAPGTKNGYVHIMRDAPSRKLDCAHRVAWELAYGPIPNHLRVLHKCDNPRCVRPAHLFLGTQQDNIRDAVRKGRWTVRKVSDDQVAEIRALAAQGALTQRAIGQRYGLSKSTVKHIVAGRSRTVRLDAVLQRVPSRQLPILGDVA